MLINPRFNDRLPLKGVGAVWKAIALLVLKKQAIAQPKLVPGMKIQSRMN